MPNERIKLEQLKAMSDAELYFHWHNREFPFEMIPSCQHCLTMHSTLSCSAHRDLAAAAQLAWPAELPKQYGLHAHIEELYALRLFYDSLYPPSTEEAPSPSRAVENQEEDLGTPRQCKEVRG